MRLADVLDESLLSEMLAGGYVRRQPHPTLPLEVYNYAEKAQYEHVWNAVTRTCRGLIVNRDTGEIVARPFRKFFNYGEPAADGLATDGPVCVTDKLDGSLGILYPAGKGWAIATRGSFVSDQAGHATYLLQQRYGWWSPVPHHTYLFEIIYPANRIVVDYGAWTDLCLIAVVDTETGRSQPYAAYGWPGPLVDRFNHRSLDTALAAAPRPGAEGLVVHFLDIDERLKIKQADYVLLHRMLTGFTARRLWERCAVHAIVDSHPDLPLKRVAMPLHLDVREVAGILDAGPDWLDEVRRIAPEEFLDWIDDTINDLATRARLTEATVQAEAERVRHMPRRDAALAIQDHPNRGLIFGALDGKPVTPGAWASIYPDHEIPFASRSEDAA